MLHLLFRPQPTFRELADNWLADAQRRQLSPHYIRETRGLLDNELAPLNSRRAGRITRRELAELVAKLDTPSKHNKALVVVSTVFGLAHASGFEGQNPALGLRKRKLQVRDRTLTRDEIRLVWHACEHLGDIGRITRLLLCTGMRRQEVGGLKWSEYNATERQLELPGARMKNRRPHVVPLSELALAQLPAERPDFPHLFGRRRGRGFSGWSKAREYIDRQIVGMPPWSFHDLRKTAATRMGELGVHDEIIERILHHSPQGVTRRHYNKSERLAQQREALERWAVEIARIVGKK